VQSGGKRSQGKKTGDLRSVTPGQKEKGKAKMASIWAKREEKKKGTEEGKKKDESDGEASPAKARGEKEGGERDGAGNGEREEKKKGKKEKRSSKERGGGRDRDYPVAFQLEGEEGEVIFSLIEKGKGVEGKGGR